MIAYTRGKGFDPDQPRRTGRLTRLAPLLLFAALAGVAGGSSALRLLDRGVAGEPLEDSVARIEALLTERDEGGDGLLAHCANVAARMRRAIAALGLVDRPTLVLEGELHRRANAFVVLDGQDPGSHAPHDA